MLDVNDDDEVLRVPAGSPGSLLSPLEGINAHPADGRGGTADTSARTAAIAYADSSSASVCTAVTGSTLLSNCAFPRKFPLHADASQMSTK